MNVRRVAAASLVAGMLAASFSYADSSDGDDQTTTNYYWQGTQLNNLSRLANTSPDFEETQRHARFDKVQDSYLATIRAQMNHQTAADNQQKTMFMKQGQLKGDPVEVVYTPTDIEVTLHAEMLFSENSSSVKVGAFDTLTRLQDILQEGNNRSMHLVIADQLDETPNASAVDAERTQMIVAFLNFPAKNADQENLSPEQLTPQ